MVTSISLAGVAEEVVEEAVEMEEEKEGGGEVEEREAGEEEREGERREEERKEGGGAEEVAIKFQKAIETQTSSKSLSPHLITKLITQQLQAGRDL